MKALNQFSLGTLFFMAVVAASTLARADGASGAESCMRYADRHFQSVVRAKMFAEQEGDRSRAAELDAMLCKTPAEAKVGELARDMNDAAWYCDNRRVLVLFKTNLSAYDYDDSAHKFACGAPIQGLIFDSRTNQAYKISVGKGVRTTEDQLVRVATVHGVNRAAFDDVQLKMITKGGGLTLQSPAMQFGGKFDLECDRLAENSPGVPPQQECEAE